jgi:hypothetical protein
VGLPWVGFGTGRREVGLLLCRPSLNNPPTAETVRKVRVTEKVVTRNHLAPVENASRAKYASCDLLHSPFARLFTQSLQ